MKKAGAATAGAALTMSGLSTLGQLSAHGARSIGVDSDDKYDFLMPRVKFDCDSQVMAYWNVYPGADRNLLQEFSSVVRCKVKLPSDCYNTKPKDGARSQFNAVVDFADMERLRKYPFLFMTAEGRYRFSGRRKENLKRYINQGGFLLMDDCVYQSTGDHFYRSSYSLLEEVFGSGSVKTIPTDHEVFQNVYYFGDTGLPYINGQRHPAKGVFVGDRLAVFLSATDIHCGWADRTNQWFGSRDGYRKSIQMGINIIMYALSH